MTNEVINERLVLVQQELKRIQDELETIGDKHVNDSARLEELALACGMLSQSRVAIYNVLREGRHFVKKQASLVEMLETSLREKGVR